MEMEKTLRLEDVFDVGLAQSLQDTLSALTGITQVIVGRNGEPFTRQSNEGGIWKLLHTSAMGREKYGEAAQSLMEVVALTNDVAINVNSGTGLVMAAVPIVAEKTLLGAVLVGDIRLECPSPALEEMAQALGLNEGQLKDAWLACPELSREKLDMVLGYLKNINIGLEAGCLSGDCARDHRKELEETSKQLDSTAKMVRRLADSSDARMYITDYYTGEVLMVNKAYLEDVGATMDEALGSLCWVLGGPAGGTTFCTYCPRDKLLDGNGNPQEPYRWENYNPLFKKWLRITNRAIPWVDGRLAHMVTYWDITEEYAMREELARMAFYDRQMALPNSQKLLQDLDAHKSHKGLYLIALDILKLRRLNDAYGRAVVDRLLCAIAEWIREQGFPGGTVYRVGGDEFGVLLEDTQEAKAKAIAEKVLRRFEQPWTLTVNAEEVHILSGASVALIYLKTVRKKKDILALLERTLETARHTGKVTVYDQEMDHRAEEHTKLEMSLKACVNDGMKGFDVFYQPIVDPASGTWRGLEALCRWTSPKLGPIAPPVFIREAEQLGLIDRIGLWVLKTAVRHCKGWKLDKQEGFFVSVNLSALQLANKNLPRDVAAILKEYDYPGEKLALEITESEELYFGGRTRDIIDKLRFRGIHISLDDFGSGYSSFKNLRSLPGSFLKTEREFILDIENDNYMQYFFSIVAELSHASDMKLIAEGVETRQQLEVVLKNGADYIQGYYFSKPMPAALVAAQLEQFHRVNAAFYLVNSEPLDAAEVYGGKDIYLITPKLFRVLNRCTRVLLSEMDQDVAFNTVLRMVGEALRVSRTYIFLHEQGTVYSNTNEWCAPGILPEKHLFLHDDIGEATPSWLPLLQRDGMIITGDTGRLPEDIQSVLRPHDMHAIAVLPMWEGKTLTGFVGFEDTRFREWLPEEITLLRNLVVIMLSSLKKERLRLALSRQGVVLADVLNNMDIPVFVTDIATDEILWANDSIKKDYPGAGAVVGTKCYELLEGRTSRCEFCKVPALEQNTSVRQCNWEYYNRTRDKYYMVYNSIVRWTDGGRAHLEYAIDITETKLAQKQLDYYAVADSLTGTLSHKRLEERLLEMVSKAQKTGKPVSIVSLDIDRLRKANETHGYSFGDMLIANVVGAVCNVFRDNDVIGRTGGDSFTLLMPDCDGAGAREIVQKAKDDLAAQHFAGTAEHYSINFGVVESTELAYEPGMEHVRDLLAIAAERMRESHKVDNK